MAKLLLFFNCTQSPVQNPYFLHNPLLSSNCMKLPGLKPSWYFDQIRYSYLDICYSILKLNGQIATFPKFATFLELLLSSNCLKLPGLKPTWYFSQICYFSLTVHKLQFKIATSCIIRYFLPTEWNCQVWNQLDTLTKFATLI